MANIHGGLKRAKTSMRKRIVNRAAKANILTLNKKFLEATTAKDLAKSKEIYRVFSSALDKAAKRGIIKHNTADRKKSRAALKIAAIKQ
jgi:small subunit ribosomal protein S20